MGLDWDWSGNTVVGVNFGWNPLVNFNFILRVEALFDLPCKSIRAFTRENEYDIIQEGGLNDYVHMRRKPISKPFTFQVERYVGVDSFDPLRNGTELILPVLLIVNRYVRGSYQPVRMYVFTGVSVMSKEYGELVADKSGLLTEVTTLAYKEMYCIDNPFTSITGDYWEFDPSDRGNTAKKPNMYGKNKGARNAQTLKDKTGTEEARQSAFETEAKKHQWRFHDASELTATKAGKGTQSASHLQTTASDGTTLVDAEPLKATMEGLAKKWEFSGTSAAGKGTRSAKHQQTTASDGKTMIDSESKKDTMEKLAKKWRFKGTDVAGEGTRSAQDPTNMAVDSTGTMGRPNVAKKKWEQEAKKHRWELDEQRKEGNTRRSAQSGNISEETKNTLEGKSSKWEFNNLTKDGNMKQSAAAAGKEPTKTATARKAVKWRFNNTSKTGNDKQSARNLALIGEEAEISKAAMEANAKKWEFDALTKAGSGTQSAAHDSSESTKAVMEAGAALWELSGQEKAGSGTQSAHTDPNEKGKKTMESGSQKWAFSETSKAGSGKRSANVTADEKDAKALEAGAVKWAFSGQSKAGGGTQSAKHPDKELSLKEMESKAVKYPKKKSAADIAKFLSKKKK
ncbi:MAG: hypothetical protein K5641_03975 [Lachnospiraceae bacterium]|nr:hypothetical protein [Lachnospiraceae bacterium]